MCCLASVCPVYPPRQHGAQNFVSLARPTANSAEMGVCCSAPLAEPSTRVQMRPTTDGEHPHGSTAVELVSRLIQAKLRTIQFAIERMLIKWNGKRGGLPLGGNPNNPLYRLRVLKNQEDSLEPGDMISHLGITITYLKLRDDDGDATITFAQYGYGYT